jgi:predicted nuclease of restriction endonuclease-like (RecB) superfamily
MPDWYGQLLESVAKKVAIGRLRAVVAANRELVLTYWAIGRDILARQEEEGYGHALIDRLSADLRDRFPSARGYSARNLRYMRAFAEAWPDPEILQQLVADLPWGHQILLLQRLSSQEARLWYAQRVIEEGWSRSILDLQVDRRLYERNGKAITNFARVLPAPDSDLAQQATKDPYLFDFVEAAGAMHERELERALIDHIEKFLLELGQGFAFVGRQQRLTIAGDDLYVDLLFFHYKLNRFVVIELKTVKFNPAFMGKIGTYMAAVDDQIKSPHHEPTIGLLLCKTKNDLMAEYALRSQTGPVGIAEWATAIETTLPRDVASKLPSVEELEAELAVTDGTPVAPAITEVASGSSEEPS